MGIAGKAGWEAGGITAARHPMENLEVSRPAPSDTQECSLSPGSSSSLSLPAHIPNKSSPKRAAQLNLKRRGDTSQRRPRGMKLSPSGDRTGPSWL